MSEPLQTLCHRLVAWLEPSVGRDLELRAPALERWVQQRLLPPVMAVVAEHRRGSPSTPDDLEARVLELLAGVLPTDEAPEPEPSFVGRGRGIHRDLGAWLRARLDAHVQREVLELDGLLDQSEPHALAARLALARTLRAAGRELVAGLAALEDGRWARWQRPKLVLESGWCVSLGLVPRGLHEEILASEPQRQRWAEALGLDATALQSLPPPQRRHLVVDTRRLARDLAERVVEGLDPEVVASASLVVRADNIDALRLLARSGPTTRCIFIDPPYNTGGNDFVYDDLYPGSTWAAMMRDRLALARGLLRDDGVLVATIDDGEVATLRCLLEQVFGRENFITQAVWHKKYARQNDATWFSTSHDHVLVAARDKATWRPNRIPRSAEQNKGYRNPDDDPRGPWQSVVYTCAKTAEQRPNLYYAIRHPRTGQPVWPERNRVWAFSPEAHARNEREGRVWWGKDQKRDKPRQKVFLRDVDRGVVPDTLWTREQVGDNQDAQRELAALFGPTGSFSTPKPRRLVERVLTLGSDPGDTVVDFFAGSGTTAHAVLDLARDGAQPRRFVLVESGETFETVLIPRIEKVAYARDWEDGRPRGGGGGGVEVACRVLTLESYEDALEQLRRDPDPLARLLDEDPFPLPPGSFAEPFDQHLRVRRGGQLQTVEVSLVDAFALLLGLRVESLSATRQRHGARCRAMWGRTPGGQRVLVLWRTLEGSPRDAEVARALVQEHVFADAELDLLYLDGAHEPEALRAPGRRFRIEGIEATVRRRLAAPRSGDHR